MDLPPKAEGERSYEGAGGGRVERERSPIRVRERQRGKEVEAGTTENFQRICGEEEQRNKIIVGRGHGNRGGMLLSGSY